MRILKTLGQLLLGAILLGGVAGVLVWLQSGDSPLPGGILALLDTPTASGLRPLSEPSSTPIALSARPETTVAGALPTGQARATPKPAVTKTAIPTSGGYPTATRPASAEPPTTVPATATTRSTVAVPPPTTMPTKAAPTITPASSAPASAASAAGTMRIGVRANLLIAPADRQRTLDLAADLGVEWIGQQVIWRDFEGQPGAINWGWLDDAVHQASGRGFRLLLSVTKAPPWAYQNDRINPAAYGNFVAALVTRYKGQVQAIEVYNEPNLASEWGGPCNAGAYAALLKEAYRRIKAVDPAVVVISAGLTPTGVSDGYTAIDDVVFLSQVKAAGGLQSCDAVGAHVSGFNNPPNAPINSRCTENPRFGCHASFYILRYRELQAVAGSKPLWVTECGYASTREPQPGYEYAQDNPENLLPDYLAETLKLMRADKVGAVFWWNLNYGPTGGEQAAFSLIDRNWSPRAHYHRLKDEVGGK